MSYNLSCVLNTIFLTVVKNLSLVELTERFLLGVIRLYLKDLQWLCG